VSEGGDRAPGKWTVEDPEGYYDAIQITGTMVAPILAGFTFAILVLVLVPPAKNQVDPLRWRDQVLALLVFSALFLIISTQAAITARTTLVKPDELRAWHPSHIDAEDRPTEWLAARQKALARHTAAASTACRHTYNAGTLLLFTAIAVLLVPPSPVDSARRAALAAAVIAVAIEATWLTGISLREKHLRGRLPTLLTPACYAIGAAVILHISPAGGSRAAAATGIVIAGIAAAGVAIRLTFRGGSCWCRIVGIVMLGITVGAGFAADLLLADRGHAVLVTNSMAAALVLLLLIVVTVPSPTALLKGRGSRNSESGSPRVTCP